MTEAPAPGSELGAWLEYLEQLDPARIELGLERTSTVLRALGLDAPPFRVFTIGGTNGKGSVAAYVAALLGAAGRGPVGVYTSPHLIDYRERISLGGRWVEAGELVAAFETVEARRAGTPLTYFEFGTLAALEVFRRAGVREAVLEVGLGGRLDAVNALEPAVAAVVSVDLDHQQWLGGDRDSIGREKAGIFRRGVAAVIGDRAPPAGLLEAAESRGSDIWLIGRDFDAEPVDTATWRYRGRNATLGPLSAPGIPGDHQRDNAAVALAMLEAVEPSLSGDARSFGHALRATRLAGRIERRRDAKDVEWVLDVAHNPAAARVLRAWLEQAPPRRTRAVLGMLGDKDAAAVAGELATVVDAWYLGGLGGPRGQGVEMLAERLAATVSAPVLCDNIRQAVARAAHDARRGERIVVFGSFHTLVEALASGLVPPEAS